VLDPADSERPKPSADAKPLPQHLLQHEILKNKRKDGVPEDGDAFHDPSAIHKWAEFRNAQHTEIRNADQVKVDVTKPERLWHYVPKGSTDSRPQYTHDPSIMVHNPKSNFMDTVRPANVPFVARHSLPGYPVGKMPIPAQHTKSFINAKPRASLPGNTSMPMAFYYSPNLPWQQSPNLPRPGYNPYSYGPTGARPSYVHPSQTIAGYQSAYNQHMSGAKASYSAPTAAPQDLMKTFNKGKAPAIDTTLHQRQNMPPQRHHLMDNSRRPNFYMKSETKFVSPPYYNTNKLHPTAQIVACSNFSVPTPPSHRRTISREHSAAIANLLISGASATGQVPPRSDQLDSIPFTPPSLRPEIQSSILAHTGPPEKKPTKPEAVNGYMEQVKRARAVSHRLDNSERLLATSNAAKMKAAETAMSDMQDGAMEMSTSALFRSLIRSDLTPTPEPPTRLVIQGAATAAAAAAAAVAASTPKMNPVETLQSHGTPDRPEFSPLSDAGMV
jgi:hypothetical protein